MKVNLRVEVWQVAKVIYDPKTKKIKKIIPVHKKILERESRSFVKNFMEILRGMLAGADITIVDQAGNSRTISYSVSINNFRVNADAADDTFGIVVGTGTTSPTPDDYTLEAKISHGTGAGQLDYGAVSVSTVAVKGNDIYIYIDRTFTNLSGADIDISEVGIISYAYGIKALIARDIFSPAITVADGAAVTIRYTIKATT